MFTEEIRKVEVDRSVFFVEAASSFVAVSEQKCLIVASCRHVITHLSDSGWSCYASNACKYTLIFSISP